MTYNILLAGVGGQGVLSLAAVIAKAAMAAGLEVRQSEVHGMSQRGGGVQAHLRIADGPVYSDLIPSGGADMILSMEPLEALRYLPFLRPDGVVVTASEPVVNIPDYPDLESVLAAIRALPSAKIVDAEEIAKQAGNPKAVNMALVGAAGTWLPLSEEVIADSVRDMFARKDPRVIDANMKALALGAAC
ncbi:MAG: indolepyruvate oxidoreductase subunit beta [Spirochaetes bacterium]|uniref:Indolepyruvate oxidoreductase subunit beta n=1 Tax=Candidatus Avitreponema avistercoris TaxID=2840705 RepID=A0A9D9HGU8_9SPIR|nr:indolepyruvate oxidoreductase subunit beta [Candidatus Avitreponema avistercoris]